MIDFYWIVNRVIGGIKVGAGTITFPDKFSYNGLFHVMDKAQPITTGTKVY